MTDPLCGDVHQLMLFFHPYAVFMFAESVFMFFLFSYPSPSSFYTATKTIEPLPFLKMPREIKNLKEFLSVCSRKDARCVKVKKNPSATKFKVRCSRFLYTFVINDKKKADKIERSIHNSVKKINVTARSHAKTNAGATSNKA
ncbi:large subunit ribosomal protein L38e [Strigomonas culicis]|uniref:Large ribosomal subunit protein eL38 n=1 Tax=Strigomonas culicis TaxID=28005 RepID=S9UBB7_9TRYP|nr:large subunit ribosomal protein L38e [Strigomonas culicis]EPY36877.1 large subunit ribosomal protein L38e [Strigomonas culicis]|eukprot:EPY26024.1 large subunit ribosomal protein L38e [Strigomonas culicis]